MIARGERLDAAESRTLQTPCEDEVPVEPAAPRRDLRERHPHVERNPGLLGKDLDRTDGADGRHDGVEERANFRRLAGEMMLEVVAAARV